MKKTRINKKFVNYREFDDYYKLETKESYSSLKEYNIPYSLEHLIGQTQKSGVYVTTQTVFT